MVINYVINGWTITSKSVFGATDPYWGTGFGFVEQDFGLKGAFGPFTIDAGMAFNAGYEKWYCEYCVYDPIENTGELKYVYKSVSAPEYMNAFLKTTLDFAGLSFNLSVEHWLYPYGCGTLMCEWQTPSGQAQMLYTLGMTVAPVSIEARFIDCCTGIMFGDAFLRMKDVGLCCGITYDTELHFTKQGFDYVWFAVKNFFPLCCGITFDLNVKFTTTAKEISLIPRFPGIEACATVYADVTNISPFGFDIYGFKISCDLSDCYKLTFLTVLKEPPEDPTTCYQPDWFYGVFYRSYSCRTSSTQPTSPLYPWPVNYCRNWNEFEYWQFDFCGAGCCGGQFKGYLRFYFGNPEAYLRTGTSPNYVYTKVADLNTLFGLTRIRGYLSVPVMSNLTVTGTWTWTLPTPRVTTNETPPRTLPAIAGALTFDIGWKLTF
jgi:hypothetical protein